MPRALTREETEVLLRWLRADALEKARELREAGWEEEEHTGTWTHPQRRGRHHLHDAHRLALGGEP